MTPAFALANRRGLMIGAAFTGKTLSLHKLAESFSAIGVPALLTDAKSGLPPQGAPVANLFEIKAPAGHAP